MNLVPPFVRCSTKTPHSLAGMAGGPSSREPFISLKGSKTNTDIGYRQFLAQTCVHLATNEYTERNLLCECERIRAISTHDKERESGSTFMPKFDAAGLLSAVVQDAGSGEILMLAFMDAEALEATRRTGIAHFHSRSRGKLWMKGETSGNVLNVEDILVDCDQDAVVLKARPAGPACHTGARSCFYRRLAGDRLERVGDDA